MVERVVKFLACIVENQRKVRRQLYSDFLEKGVLHIGWYHGSTHRQIISPLRVVRILV